MKSVPPEGRAARRVAASAVFRWARSADETFRRAARRRDQHWAAKARLRFRCWQGQRGESYMPPGLVAAL